MTCHWRMSGCGEETAPDVLVKALGVSRLLATVLAGRGLGCPDRARAFLTPRLQSLGDPLALPDMGAAVERLWRTRDAGTTVVLFGDYDVDGVTATALLEEALTELGWRVVTYLPDRFAEGYGLSPEAVQTCLARTPTDLLVAVDCGSSSGRVIDELRARGVDVIVVDHHQLGDPLPQAVALVNPHRMRKDAANGCADLCSAGLAFKLLHALVKEGRRQGRPEAQALDPKRWLDLVALGTVADLVPLAGENRVLVSAGLRHLESGSRVGLRALMEVARTGRPLGAQAVGFQLAPRLNAAGRLASAQGALELLRCRDPRLARQLAEQLDAQNRDRQEMERRIAKQAIERVRERFVPERDFVILEGDPEWHLGVVGIVASRVARAFHRPALILGGDGDVWRGSGRSIAGFDLATALRACGDLLRRHGGHAMAAGLALDPARLDVLRERLNALARSQLSPEALQPLVRVDAELALKELSLESIDELGRLEPFGQGNPPVHVVIRGLRLTRPVKLLGPEGQHVKFAVGDGEASAEVVWWGGGTSSWPSGTFDMVVQPDVNEFAGRRTVQLRLLDWRLAESPNRTG